MVEKRWDGLVTGGMFKQWQRWQEEIAIADANKRTYAEKANALDRIRDDRSADDKKITYAEKMNAIDADRRRADYAVKNSRLFRGEIDKVLDRYERERRGIGEDD